MRGFFSWPLAWQPIAFSQASCRRLAFWPISFKLCALLAATTAAVAQQSPDPFRWMDFHAQKDQDIVVWVSHAIAAEKWTAIREIGVQYDAALVVTTLRSSPDSPANQDSFNVWSVSLTTHALTPLLTGYNLRWLDFMTFTEGEPQELALLYDSCAQCSPETYFTAFHFDIPQHMWAARWLRGGQGAPLWNANPPAGVDWTQVYAGLAEPNGRDQVGTWSHFDYGKQKPAEDFVYRYDLDPFSHLERTQLLSGKDADAMKLRLCRSGEVLPGLARGQNSPLCQQLVNPRPERKPVTTPPAHNRGQSIPPGSRPKPAHPAQSN
jgi:hypothetical protein